MTTDHDDARRLKARQAAPDRSLDDRARALHAQAVERVPMRTLRELRTRRRNPQAQPQLHALGWATAVATLFVFALALGLWEGLQPRPPSQAVSGLKPLPQASGDALPLDSTYADALVALDEDPGLYLWLASSDVQPLAME